MGEKLLPWPEAHVSPSTLALQQPIEEAQSAFDKAAPRIFSPATSGYFRVQVGEVDDTGLRSCVLENDCAVAEYLNTSHDIDKTESPVSFPGAVPSSPKSTFFLLNPTFGWGRLMLSETSMRSILRHVHAFPAFLKHLTAFGEKGFARDEGFAAYDIQEHFNGLHERQGLETCFLWKYIQHDDGTAQHPWTIRQALVYQNFSCTTQTSTNILIRAPLQVTNLLKHNFNTSAESRASTVAEWLGVQKVCISCGTEEWRQALNYYDEQITKLFDELVMFSIETETAGDSKKVQQCVSSMKELTHLVDQLLRISHMLGLNSRIIHSMMDAARRYESAERRDAFLIFAETVQLQYDFLRQLTESLLARGNNLSRQLRDIIAFRNSELNNRIANATSTSTGAVVELTLKSSHEARIVKVLTVVALIYVPASFAADFLQMGYVSVDEDRNFHIVASMDVWLWVIIAFPLILLALSVLFICEILGRRKVGRAANPNTTVFTNIV
ncbi:uncharacterized protein Z519_08283 [Cladophialophora bantiana CBS 173.52]|uniref:CorA-like transporter domain-containing protein n=1 Tax=Cladophialophora bantiana (strain ATCC 10958 / CBS 173.52 / CDC B-1940 / NIH 8579) TaxID=1442370 RepID=A0A0D2FY41_CLAB1|nr:uncharacterized protein Z519_08283 [Cladophialophora bantiana CBS 173.52]KIW91387.1 hypothetical protein Z519_08283 [Cladophialophora bantiana CBS 173.52]